MAAVADPVSNASSTNVIHKLHLARFPMVFFMVPPAADMRAPPAFAWDCRLNF
jgi:hypothetical protein